LQVIEPAPVQVVARYRVPSLHEAIEEYQAEQKAMGSRKGSKNIAFRLLELHQAGRPISRESVLAFRNKLDTDPNYTGGTPQLYWSIVKGFLDWLVIAGYTKVKIASGIRPPSIKESKQARMALKEPHYRKIMEVETHPVMRYIYAMMWHTGMAVVDAVSLQIRELDLETATITRVRQKTAANDRPCIIPFPKVGELWDLLTERSTHWEGESDRWPNINGMEYVHPEAWLMYESQRVAMHWHRKTRPKLGLMFRHFGLHSFRRGFVTRLAEGGINPTIGCQVTGHRDPTIFQSYVQSNPETIRAEAERALTEASRR
jgi:integrase